MKRRLKTKVRAIGKSKKLFWVTRGIQILLLSLVIFAIPIETHFFVSKKEIVKAEKVELSVSPYPVVGKIPQPSVSATSYIVLDGNSGVMLAQYQADAIMHPASLTKLMTALVALDYYSLDQILTVKRLALVQDESEMGLAIGDRLAVRNLLYGLLVPSGNDAAYALSDNFPGGIENFIYSMNKKAAELSLSNTHFLNQNGADQDNHLSTAKDLINLARVAVENENIKTIVGTSGITLPDADRKKNYKIKNVNQLLGVVSGLDGIKTGYTDLAGQSLVSSTTRNGHTIYTIVLQSGDRFADTTSLINWAFTNTIWQRIVPPV